MKLFIRNPELGMKITGFTRLFHGFIRRKDLIVKHTLLYKKLFKLLQWGPLHPYSNVNLK